ncbi:MAG: CBS domain-containing protein [Nitrospinota bacterium]
MQVITTHFNADFDCLASMMAAKKLYPDARLVFPGSQEKNVRDFLKASEYSFEFNKIKNIPMLDIDLLIVVDTKLRGRIGVFGEIIDRPGLKIHIYDHHPADAKDIVSEVEIVKERGAATTIFVELLKEKNILLTPAEATIMELGIYEDTGSLTFSSTTPKDLEAAAYLLSIGANLNTVSDFIYRELSSEQISLLDDLIHSAESYDINGVQVVIATASTGKYVGDLAILTHKLKDMENLNVLFTLVAMDDRVHLVGRSRIEAVDVAGIALEFGGGGHPTAASASIPAKIGTLIQIKERLLKLLRERIHGLELVGDMMTSSVISVRIRDTIKDAEKIMTRFNINSLPVLKDRIPAGLITRQIVEKAIFHKFKEEKVSEFMLTEFSAVYPDAPFREVDRLIIENKQKLVPVIDNKEGDIVGIVSRGDLLRILYGDMLKKPGLLHPGDAGTRYSYRKNVKDLMLKRLPEHILKLFKVIAHAADKKGYPVYVVGGFVRDILMRLENLDIDIVVEGDGIALAGEIAKELSGRIRSHEKFGTAVVILADGFKVDVATARAEYYKYPAALPIVELSSIKMDLYRRDFTINALAIKLNGKDANNLIDFFGGQRDLKEKMIRVLHNLSFVEDPTRVFRAIRFEQRFNFTIGRQTQTLLENAVKRGLFNRLSGARLYGEIVQMLKEKEPLRSIKRMSEFDLLRFIHPLVSLTDETHNLLREIAEVTAWYNLLFLEDNAEIWFVYLMGLFDRLNLEELREAVINLSISARYADRLINGKEMAEKAMAELSEGHNLTPSQTYKILHPLSLEVLLFLMSGIEEEKIRRHISLYLIKLKSVEIDVSGEDLIEIGLTPGPLFRSILDAIKEAKLNGRLMTKKEELEFVKENYL